RGQFAIVLAIGVLLNLYFHLARIRGRVPYWMFAVLCAGALFYSGSRAGVVSVLLGGLIMVHRFGKISRYFSITLGGGIVVYFFLFILGGAETLARYDLIGLVNDPAALARLDGWQRIFTWFSDSPGN